MAEKSAPARRKGRLKKMALTLAFILLFYIAGSIAAAFIVPDVVFVRSEPRPEDLEIPYSEFSIPRRETGFMSGSNELRGYYYGAESARGLIVFVHGFRSGADAHLPEIERFVSGGWSVFAFDGTGSRESGGAGTVGLPQMKYDLLHAIEFAESEFPGLPVVLYGHSQGAYAAAAVLDDRPEISAAVLVAGFDSPIELMLYHARREAGFFADLESPFLALQNYMTFGKDGNEKASDAISSGETPVLIIRGDSDEVVPEELSIASGEIKDPNAAYLVLPGGHSDLWLTRDAVDRRAAAETRLFELHTEHGDTLPDEVWEEFLSGVDIAGLWETDEDFFSAVLSFFEGAVSR